jgi:hypothetical protein
MSETTVTARTEGTTQATASAARRRERAIVTASAAAAALVLWGVAAVGSDTDLQALRQGDLHVVGPGAVLITATLAAVAGWALLAVLERVTPRARTVWTGVAIVALLASLGGPLSGGVGTGSKVVLTLMHLVVGAVVIVGLRRTAR